MHILSGVLATTHDDRLEHWSNYHCIASIIGLLFCISLGSPVAFIIISFISMSILMSLNTAYLLPQFNYSWDQSPNKVLVKGSYLANWVTLLRFSLAIYVMLTYSKMSAFTIFGLMSTVVLLDTVDGYIARRLNTTSNFGRIFDMESDAFFVSSMGLYFYFTTSFGLWLLIPGALRYLYRLTVWLGPSLHISEKKQAYAAILAGVNFILLLAAIITSGFLQFSLLFISAVIVSFSFSVSFLNYFSGLKNS